LRKRGDNGGREEVNAKLEEKDGMKEGEGRKEGERRERNGRVGSRRERRVLNFLL
jgi:hypothetical protein